MRVDKIINDVLVRLFWIARRVDPYVRPVLDIAVRPWLQALVRWHVRRRLPDHGLALAEERELPGERTVTDQIIDAMGRFTRLAYAGRHAERAGNTRPMVLRELSSRSPTACRHSSGKDCSPNRGATVPSSDLPARVRWRRRTCTTTRS